MEEETHLWWRRRWRIAQIPRRIDSHDRLHMIPCDVLIRSAAERETGAGTEASERYFLHVVRGRGGAGEGEDVIDDIEDLVVRMWEGILRCL